MKKTVYLLIFTFLLLNVPALADNPSPAITSFSPTTITPSETVLTITGTGFGEPFNSLENLICFGAGHCYDATGLNDYLQLWSDTEIQVLVPEDIWADSATILLKVYFPDTDSFDFIESADSYTVELLPDPLISSFSPTEVTPGEMVITISGIGFGDAYAEGTNQICFEGSGCIADADIGTYLQSWSDTEVQVTVPAFVDTPGVVTIYGYFFSWRAISYTESPSQFTIAQEEVTVDTTISPIYSGSIFDEDEDGTGDNDGTGYYEGGQPSVGVGEWGEWEAYAATANAEYDISVLSGGTIVSATLSAGAWHAKPGDITVSWYYYEGDGVRAVTDFHQSGILFATAESSGNTYVLSLDVTDELQGLVNADASYAAFRGARTAGSGSVGWYEPVNLEVTYIAGEDVADDDVDEPASEITSFSPTLLVQGETLVTITGTGFGDSYLAGSNQICFGSICISDEDIDTYLSSWADTEVSVLVPENLGGPGKIKLKVYSADLEDYAFIESSTNYRRMPEITSFFPTELESGETILTISGYEFGSGYVAGSNQICFENNGCIPDEDIDAHLQSWSETEIQVLVPEFVTISGRMALVLQIPTTEEYGIAYSEDTFTVAGPSDPEITSISPNILVPEDTDITITGHGFGDSYEEGYSQICFNESCISDGSLPFYLQTWSDTEIVITTPSFVNSEESGTIFIKAYFPSTGYYDFIESSAYTVQHKPVIEWYYREMDQGGTYDYSGYYFGGTPGKVVLNELECEIVSWSDTDVTFTVPLNASSGDVYIENAEGIKSSSVYAVITSIKQYSNDEYSRYQWHLGTINIEDAWEITEGSSDVVVAVIDSGVDINHEDLEHAIWKNTDEVAGNGVDDDNNGYADDVYGWDFVLNSNSTVPRGVHGTMVSSMIAAKKDNGVGLAGIAPNVKIMPLNIANFDGYTVSVDGALLAVKYAVDNGADIINMSFGGPDSLTYYEDIVQYAYDNNVLVVASTGNEGADLDYYSSYAPVCVDLNCNAIIGVASTNEYDIVSYFSNYGGVCTDLAAPGEYLPVAVPTDYGYYGTADGTSFSSPLAAAVAALVKSKNPSWNIEEIKYVLLDTARNIDDLNPYYAGKIGEGVPDAYAALQASKPDVSYNYNPHTDIDIEETGVDIEIEIPEVDPITDDPEPIKDESIDEDITEMDTDPELYESPESSFPDVEGHKYEEAIASLENDGIIHGHPDGTFKPDYEINRAEFTKIVIGAFVDEENIYGTYCFPDVRNDWYAPYVCTAQWLEIIHGYPDSTFKPDKMVNTVEALKIVLEMQGLEFYPYPGEDWFAPYVFYAIGTSLDFILYENDLDENVTRGQMAEMIYRVMEGL